MFVNQQYRQVIKDAKFITKPNAWFVEGSTAQCPDENNYSEYNDGDKFNKGWGLFHGITHETYAGYTGELPRPDGETCPFDEFFIYDIFGNEISELTLDEYNTKFKTSDVWQKEFPHIKILDPDGWDRTNYQFSWFEERISYDEYMKRMMTSTCMGHNPEMID